MKNVEIYTDGACIGNPGPGGYGTILRHGATEKELAEGFRLTTNNRMELMAAIVGLEALKGRRAVDLHSDSEYVVKGIAEGRAERWEAKGWKRDRNKPVVNVDLWRRLLALTRLHEVRFHWVRGHAGHPENERCDELAVAAYQNGELALDAEYEALAAASADESA